MSSCPIMFIAFYSFQLIKYDLSKIVANGKRFIAYEIIKRLKQKQCYKVLMQLQEGLSVKQLEKGQPTCT